MRLSRPCRGPQGPGSGAALRRLLGGGLHPCVRRAAVARSALPSLQELEGLGWEAADMEEFRRRAAAAAGPWEAAPGGGRGRPGGRGHPPAAPPAAFARRVAAGRAAGRALARLNDEAVCQRQVRELHLNLPSEYEDESGSLRDLAVAARSLPAVSAEAAGPGSGSQPMGVLSPTRPAAGAESVLPPVAPPFRGLRGRTEFLASLRRQIAETQGE